MAFILSRHFVAPKLSLFPSVRSCNEALIRAGNWKQLGKNNGINPGMLRRNPPHDIEEFEEGVKSHRWFDTSAADDTNGRGECVIGANAVVLGHNLSLRYENVVVKFLFQRLETMVNSCWGRGIALMNFYECFNRFVKYNTTFLPDGKRAQRYLCLIDAHHTDDFEEALQMMHGTKYRCILTMELPCGSLHAVMVKHTKGRILVCQDILENKEVLVSEGEFVEFVLPVPQIIDVQDGEGNRVAMPLERAGVVEWRNQTTRSLAEAARVAFDVPLLP